MGVLKYCGRVERLMKRLLMLIGVFSVLYVITYNYHLLTVNIVSRDVAYVHDRAINRAEISVVHHRDTDYVEDNLQQEAGVEAAVDEGGDEQDKDGSPGTEKDGSPGTYEAETGAEELAEDDPNHPGAAAVFDANGGDEYEGGEEQKSGHNQLQEEDPDAPGASEGVPGGTSVVAPEVAPEVAHEVAPEVAPGVAQVRTTIPVWRPSKSKSRGRKKKHKARALALASVTTKPVIQHPVTEVPIDGPYCARKLEILEQRLHQLAQRIASVTFSYGRPLKNSGASRDTCVRYRNEARVETRYNVTNIWSSVQTINPDDITFVTQMTPNRMGVLHQVAEHWTGPISVAIYTKKEELSLIAKMLKEHMMLLNRRNVEFHVVIEHGEYYPVNFLRNVAFKSAVTKYVYLSDVDFVPSMGLHDNLKARIDQGLLENRTVLVVPGFQFKKGQGKDFPANKNELLQLWKKKKVEPFHWYFRFGHRATNFGKWRKTTEPYYINWEDGFEPYILGKRDELPLYSQRFLSRVRNKTSQITEVYYMGFWFKVLPDVFTIHMPHSISKAKTYYYWCSAHTYGSFRKGLKKKYPAKIYRSRGSPH